MGGGRGGRGGGDPGWEARADTGACGDGGMAQNWYPPSARVHVNALVQQWGGWETPGGRRGARMRGHPRNTEYSASEPIDLQVTRKRTYQMAAHWHGRGVSDDLTFMFIDVYSYTC